MSILVVRTFVKLRELIATHEVLSRRLDEIDRKHDHNFASLYVELKRLTSTTRSSRRRRIGFGTRS